MLENEEVDDDYFTPIAKTSLANLFQNPFSGDKTDNETLTYTPPSPKSVLKTEDEPKAKPIYENIFSCVLNAYLWLNNVYTHQGKLGFAIVNLINGTLNYHSIILYDSKKATVSTTKVTKELEVTVKGKDFISYYDSYQKYWSLYGSEDDIKKIISILESLTVQIKFSKDSDNARSEQTQPETTDFDRGNASTTEFEPAPTKNQVQVVNTENKHIESDTDSSVNRKTKASILSRMANMGQSVLPPHTIPKELASYSSDSNESDKDIITVRPKPIMIKKALSEKTAFSQQKNNVHKKLIMPKAQHSMENKALAVIEDQIMPLQSSSIVTNTLEGQDFNFFITEQRIANSELRINMNRMTDKIDHVLNKLNNIEKTCTKEDSANINTEILHKLLKEYEGKIKTYEEILKNMNTIKHVKPSTTDVVENKDDLVRNEELVVLKNKITEFNKCLIQKEDEITLLKEEIVTLKANNNAQFTLNINELLTRISKLEDELSVKNEILKKTSSGNNEVNSKVKTIMNDTFRAVGANFDRTKSYSGEEIHNIIAAVIKKVTIDSLNKTKE